MKYIGLKKKVKTLFYANRDSPTPQIDTQAGGNLPFGNIL